MNTFINHKQTPLAVLILAGLLGSSTLAAQDSLSQNQLPPPSEDESGCQELDWNESLLSSYPWVLASCHEVIMVDGQEWARFEAEFEGMNSDGTFDADFQNVRGGSEGAVSLDPGPNQTVMIDGREYAFSELRENQMLNFYVPEGAAEFAIEPDAASNETLLIVDLGTSDDRFDRFARSDQQRANSDRDQNRDRDRSTLPATAGPLPMLALGGMFAMLGGLGMTIRRRRTSSKN